MSYLVASVVAGQTLGLVGASTLLLLRTRRGVHALNGALAAALALVFFALATPPLGASIDLRLGVILLGAYRNDPVGFDWPWFFAGCAAGAALVAFFGRPAARGGPERLRTSVLAVSLLELVVAREATVNRRLESLAELAEGARHVAGRAQHRVMDEPVPALEDDHFSTAVVYGGLDVPTSMSFGSDGSVFIGLKAGKILFAPEIGAPLRPLFEVKPVQAVSESGLLELLVHPDYPAVPYLYVYFTVLGTSRNRLIRLALEPGGKVVGDIEMVLDGIPGFFMHNGGGLAFGRDGKLYVGTGTADFSSVQADRSTPPGPQGWSSLHGKILRMEPDGSVPADNPFAGSHVFARGVREVFRMQLDPLSGRIFASENGIGDHDEINVIHPGANYGYPVYSGVTGVRGFEDPVLDIYKSIGITGLSFYQGDVYPSRYKNDLFFCSYVTGAIYWLALDERRSSRLPTGPVRAIRPSDPTTDCRIELEEGPDGLFYFTNEKGLYRLDHVEGAGSGEARVVDGAELYKSYCTACHQPTGAGVANMYPPLAGSEWVSGDAGRLARIVLFGLSGKIVVRGQTYNQKMLPFGTVLDDEQLASLLTFIRSNFGNNAPAVPVEVVKDQRENGVALRLE